MKAPNSADADIPQDIDRDAPVVVRRDRVIAGPIERIWALHTDIPRWPVWQRDVATASLDGPVAAGTSFNWTTPGLDTPIVSTIYAIDAERTVLWGGPSGGIIGIHHWSFEVIAGGTRVTTEESWSGGPIDANPREAERMLASSLERWLNFLADASTS